MVYSVNHLIEPMSICNHPTDSREDTGVDCADLKQLFGSEEQIIYVLKHRFDNLPIHKMLYYQPYNNITVDQLNNTKKHETWST